MNNAREAIRVMQPDDKIKIVLSTAHENPALYPDLERQGDILRYCKDSEVQDK